MNKSTSKRTTSDEGASGASSIKKMKQEMDIAAECCICNEILKDSCMLICCHFFCRACVEPLIENTLFEMQIKCPLCYQVTEIHSDGVDQLACGQFLVKLAAFNKLKDRSSGQSCDNLCSPCLGIGRNKMAAGYCIECQEDLCKSCLQRHKIMKVSKSHTTVDNAKLESKEQLKTGVSFCREHPGQKFEFYCKDCKSAACITCKEAKHKRHSTFDINDWSLRTQTGIGVESAVQKRFIVDSEDAIKCIERSKDKFMTEASNMKIGIEFRFQFLVGKLLKQREFLKNTLDTWTTRHERNLEELKSDVKRNLNAMKRFQTFWSELKNFGSACDIVEASNSLQNSSSELMNKFRTLHGHISYDTGYELSFTRCHTDLDKKKNVLGKLKLVLGDDFIQEDDISNGPGSPGSRRSEDERDGTDTEEED